MVKHPSILLIVLFCFMMSHGQRFKKIVLKDFQNKELTVFTKNFDELNVSENLMVTYRDSLFRVNPDEIKYFTVNNVTYDSHIIDNKAVFLRRIEKGKVNLYLHQHSNFSVDTEDPSMIMQELKQEFYVSFQNKIYAINKSNYRTQLQSLLPNIEILPSEGFNDLTTIISRFND